MKWRCECGETLELNKEEYTKPFRMACPKCVRCYKVKVVRVQESPEFWKGEGAIPDADL